MSGYVITGTGTDVGKTFATCALIYGSGHQARAYKPIVSGFTGEDTDSHRLLEAMGEGSINDISPWRFSAPLSPDMAAAREGKTISFDDVARWCAVRAAMPGLSLFEGVGGVMVPINARYHMRDWMQALKLPVILVAGTYLGSISHTLTAIEALRARNIFIRAVLLTESAESPAPLAEIASAIHSHITGMLIVSQPRVSSYRQASAIQAFAKELI